MKEISFTVSAEKAGMRLDKFLGDTEEVGTRSRAQHLINDGKVTSAGTILRSSSEVKEGQTITVMVPIAASPTELVPLNVPLDIIFEDDSLIVVNKPSGMVVHPSFGHQQDTLVNALIHHTQSLSMKYEMRPGIVHRIDKETSGLLVVAKNDLIHEHLSQQFKDRTTKRTYEALCMGQLMPVKGRIESHLGRHPTDRKKFASQKDESGKLAITHYELLKVAHGISFVKLKLETGRTHQIRVHMAEKGHPLVGDKLYHFSKKNHLVKNKDITLHIKNLDRFMLHARDLGFVHPITKEEMSFTVEWPPADLLWLKSLGFK
ncbi:MAG: RluA family pseudouridine synthase [Bdellovibrionota bacterium]